jgi:hypothetical protein
MPTPIIDGKVAANGVAEMDSIYGRLGSSFAGDSKTVSQAFTLAQLGPLKAYRKPWL